MHSMAQQTGTGVGVRPTLELHWETPLLRHLRVFFTFLKNSTVPVETKSFVSCDVHSYDDFFNGRKKMESLCSLNA